MVSVYYYEFNSHFALFESYWTVSLNSSSMIFEQFLILNASLLTYIISMNAMRLVVNVELSLRLEDERLHLLVIRYFFSVYTNRTAYFPKWRPAIQCPMSKEYLIKRRPLNRQNIWKAEKERAKIEFSFYNCTYAALHTYIRSKREIEGSF